ncbi:DUF2069 domain-containing protein [Idiomarina sp.]|uniref:DUF2069 domain-containing protein n=1 Tax=Idiomarina sp. TaxID=1874361 RepID=UPI0025C1185E|nr:DUF2069 domain-containing protein [Idiomarina sp.]NQZ04395.1 DUF2069 domain-containing protein [Idiomarina sp.]
MAANMAPKTRFFRIATQLGYWLLLALLVIWHGVMPETDEAALPTYLSLIFWVLPMLFPLLGLVKGKPYTHAWFNFILMFYFLHGLTTVYTHPDERLWSVLEIIFTTIAFIGATGFARHRGRELGLGLKKQKNAK